MKKPEQLSFIMSIVERGSGGKLVKLYQKNQVFTHIRFEGLGTATSEILDILGLGGSEQDIILSMTTRSAAAAPARLTPSPTARAVRRTGDTIFS